jgi:OmpA-OmpF porin, OOP family
MHKSIIFKAVSGAALASTMLMGVAFAQSNPSAQQIISALKPVGTVSTTTRGIMPLSSGSSSSSSAAAPSAAAPVATPAVAQAPSTNLNIVFGSGSANLTPQAVHALDQLGKALSSPELAAYSFKIVGHTDTTGAAAANETLSQQRAAAVQAYLETKFGISASRLTSTGVGEADLLVQTPPGTPELRNRRVQIINLGP